jgi:ADP-heptose:LPS heptosyltransferase
VVAGPREPSGLPLPPGVPLLRHERGEVRRLVALGALLARAGGRAVGPDQGPVHVLAAAGADVVALYGPQDPRRTAPVASTVLVRRDGPPCVPCRRRVCDHEAGPVCMRFATTAGVRVPHSVR